jgi:hypothetical protein
MWASEGTAVGRFLARKQIPKAPALKYPRPVRHLARCWDTARASQWRRSSLARLVGTASVENHLNRLPVAWGGARGSKGSRALHASLSKCLRMRSTTHGSVITETMVLRMLDECRR